MFAMSPIANSLQGSLESFDEGIRRNSWPFSIFPPGMGGTLADEVSTMHLRVMVKLIEVSGETLHYIFE